MKHIIFIAAESSAVTTCCFNIAEEMAKHHRVTIVCKRSYTGEPATGGLNGQTILRITDYWWDLRLLFTDRISKKRGVAKMWYTLLLNAVRLKERLQIIFSGSSIRRDLVRSYLRVLNKVSVPADAVIPFCNPMDAVVAGMEYKKKVPGTKLIPYLFDPFVENKILHRTEWNKQLKKKIHIRIEKTMLALSSRVFCVDHLEAHFAEFKNYEKSMTFTDHPLLKKKQAPDASTSDQANRKIKITYTGMFEYLIRNPTYFLKTMSKVLDVTDAELHLYIYSNCGRIIDKYAGESNGRMIDHGWVNKEIADHAIVNSDLLVSIGNIDNTQVPSKIIEYISVCRPIIHFYSNDDDSTLHSLKDYPLGLCLKQEEALLDENVNRCITFIKNNKDKMMDFSEVETIYYRATPKFVNDQILAVIAAE